MEAEIIVLSNLSTSYFSKAPEKFESNSPTWMIEVMPMQTERRESMDTGMRLKYHRLKKRMSIEDLASAILLPKELKKIEAGLKEPALKDLEALCKKLEIPLAPKDNPVGKVLVKNFKSLLLHPQNKAKIMEQYADIHDHPLLHNDEETEMEYSIQQIRFFIITGDLDSAEEKLKEIDRFKEFMNQEQFYLFHKYSGNYEYILNEFEKAFKTYLFAEKIAPQTISTSELGDLYYSLSLTASQCWEVNLASRYSEMALKIYQQEFIPKRIVECHLNLAINERRKGNYQTAEEHFRLAVNIGNKLDIDLLKFITEYNYGYLYFNVQNFKLAINHLENALKYIPEEYTSDLLLNYCLLIKCHIEENNSEAAKLLITKGKQTIDEKNLNLNVPSNNSFKEVYIEFLCLSHLLNDNFSEYEKDVLEKLLPILETNKKYYEIGFFLGHLGNYFFKGEEFKKAAMIYSKAKEAYKKLMKIN